jgi:ubiquinone/menaquinone biosynthesis C-methylase UbiE
MNNPLTAFVADRICASSKMTERRAALIPLARGRVVEIGAGSGLNLRHYGPEVEHVWAVEPSTAMWALARDVPARVEHVHASAEAVPLPDHLADTVVVTWTLCSVRDPARAVTELRRLLTPDGTLIFAEHGRAEDARVRWWQERLDPIWRRVSGGCSMSRDTLALLRGGGFDVSGATAGWVPGTRVLSWQTWGTARLG